MKPHVISIRHRSPAVFAPHANDTQDVLFLWQNEAGKKELRKMSVTIHDCQKWEFGQHEPISMDYDCGEMFVPYYPHDLSVYDICEIIEANEERHEVLREVRRLRNRRETARKRTRKMVSNLAKSLKTYYCTISTDTCLPMPPYRKTTQVFKSGCTLYVDALTKGQAQKSFFKELGYLPEVKLATWLTQK